jgi:hypothetical protein
MTFMPRILKTCLCWVFAEENVYKAELLKEVYL